MDLSKLKKGDRIWIKYGHGGLKKATIIKNYVDKKTIYFKIGWFLPIKDFKHYDDYSFEFSERC